MLLHRFPGSNLRPLPAFGCLCQGLFSHTRCSTFVLWSWFHRVFLLVVMLILDRLGLWAEHSVLQASRTLQSLPRRLGPVGPRLPVSVDLTWMPLLCQLLRRTFFLAVVPALGWFPSC
jgi:hypothetical protein